MIKKPLTKKEKETLLKLIGKRTVLANITIDLGKNENFILFQKFPEKEGGLLIFNTTLLSDYPLINKRGKYV